MWTDHFKQVQDEKGELEGVRRMQACDEDNGPLEDD